MRLFLISLKYLIQPKSLYTPPEKGLFHALVISKYFNWLARPFLWGDRFEQARKDALTIELATTKDTAAYLETIPVEYQQHCVKEAMKYICNNFKQLDPDPEKMDMLTSKLSLSGEEIREVAQISNTARQYLLSYVMEVAKKATQHEAAAPGHDLVKVTAAQEIMPTPPPSPRQVPNPKTRGELRATGPTKHLEISPGSK